MAKKKMNLGMIVSGVAALLGLIALIMLFVPQLSAVKGDATLNGLKITFGYTEKNEILGVTTEAKILDFSFMNFLTYILLLAGIVCAVLAALGKSKIFTFVSIACFVVAGVFFFLAKTFMVVHTGDLEGDLKDAAIDAVKDIWKLGAGAIVGGILSILAALASASTIFLKK